MNKRNKNKWPAPFKKGKASSREEKLSALNSIDHKLIDLIQRRNSALLELSSKKNGQILPLMEANQERLLWQIWENRAERDGLDKPLLRKLFNLLNDLGYKEIETGPQTEFELRPYRAPVRIDLPGPCDDLLIRTRLVLAIGRQSALNIPQTSINDPLYELLKALNQAQADLSWEDEKITYQGKKPDFDRKALFVGNDPFNLYLCIVLALLEPGTCKIIGGVNLKQQDLRPLFSVLPLLGARAVSIVPGSQGLPIRLECSAAFNEQIFLPEDIPQELLLALVCLGSLLPKDKITLLPGKGVIRQTLLNSLEETTSFLSIQTKLHPGRIEVFPQDREKSPTQVPEQSVMPIDPALSAYLLGIPLYTGGQVSIRGYFPVSTPLGERACQLLKEGGLEVQINEQGIHSTAGQSLSPEITFTGPDKLFPLAIALACAHNTPTQVRITASIHTDEAFHILSQLGTEPRLQNEVLHIPPLNNRTWPICRVTAPSPFWCLGLALIALKRKNIILRNPGLLTEVWPKFWSIYRDLPNPGLENKKELKGDTENERPRKRIIVD